MPLLYIIILCITGSGGRADMKPGFAYISVSRHGRHGSEQRRESCPLQSHKRRAASLLCLSLRRAFTENTCTIELHSSLLYLPGTEPTYRAEYRLTGSKTGSNYRIASTSRLTTGLALRCNTCLKSGKVAIGQRLLANSQLI